LAQIALGEARPVDKLAAGEAKNKGR